MRLRGYLPGTTRNIFTVLAVVLLATNACSAALAQATVHVAQDQPPADVTLAIVTFRSHEGPESVLNGFTLQNGAIIQTSSWAWLLMAIGVRERRNGQQAAAVLWVLA